MTVGDDQYDNNPFLDDDDEEYESHINNIHNSTPRQNRGVNGSFIGGEAQAVNPLPDLENILDDDYNDAPHVEEEYSDDDYSDSNNVENYDDDYDDIDDHFNDFQNDGEYADDDSPDFDSTDDTQTNYPLDEDSPSLEVDNEDNGEIEDEDWDIDWADESDHDGYTEDETEDDFEDNYKYEDDLDNGDDESFKSFLGDYGDDSFDDSKDDETNFMVDLSKLDEEYDDDDDEEELDEDYDYFGGVTPTVDSSKSKNDTDFDDADFDDEVDGDDDLEDDEHDEDLDEDGEEAPKRKDKKSSGKLSFKDRINDAKSQILSELKGDDSHSKKSSINDDDDDFDEDDEDENNADEKGASKKPKKKQNDGGPTIISKVTNPITGVYSKFIDLVYGLLMKIFNLLGKIPGVGALTNRLMSFEKYLRIAIGLLPLFLLIFIMHSMNSGAIPKAKDYIYPDGGGSTITDVKVDGDKIIGTVNNTGDTIMDGNVNYTVYSTKILSPKSWFSPSKITECKSNIVHIEAGDSIKVTATCKDSLSGLGKRASGEFESTQ